jgi:DNA-directed RNA polymerase omega subunit
MKLPLEDLEKLGLNRYEAVIVAAKHARHLNTQRLRTLELMEEHPEVDIEARKMTMVALKDLLEGKVNFQRTDTE